MSCRYCLRRVSCYLLSGYLGQVSPSLRISLRYYTSFRYVTRDHHWLCLSLENQFWEVHLAIYYAIAFRKKSCSLNLHSSSVSQCFLEKNCQLWSFKRLHLLLLIREVSSWYFCLRNEFSFFGTYLDSWNPSWFYSSKWRYLRHTFSISDYSLSLLL